LANELELHLTEKTAGLDADERRAVYTRAREALQNEVRSSAPFMPVKTVVTRRRELENAIMAVEREASKGEPIRRVKPPAPKIEEKVQEESPQDLEAVADTQAAEPASPVAVDQETLKEPATAEWSAEAAQDYARYARQMEPHSSSDIRDVSLASYDLLAKALEDISDEEKQRREGAPDHSSILDDAHEEIAVAHRKPVILYLGVLALVLCAIALAVLLVGFGADRTQVSAPAQAARPKAPVVLPPPASPEAELVRGAGFQGAAKDALTHANALLAKHEFPRAIAAFDDAIRLDSSNAAALAGRAYAHWNAGNIDAAIRDYSASIDRDPKNAATRLNRAIAYNRKGEYKLAVDDLDRAIAIGPASVDALNSRCWARAVLSYLEEALADCNKALTMKPDDADILDSRGFVFLRLGRLERAIADYDAVLKQRPKLASALYGRGLARIGRGDRAGGQEDVAAARAVDPDVVAAFARYGVR
jgi:tetratricopeptide (TPR) repeat protein